MWHIEPACAHQRQACARPAAPSPTPPRAGKVGLGARLFEPGFEPGLGSRLGRFGLAPSSRFRQGEFAPSSRPQPSPVRGRFAFRTWPVRVEFGFAPSSGSRRVRAPSPARFGVGSRFRHGWFATRFGFAPSSGSRRVRVRAEFAPPAQPGSAWPSLVQPSPAQPSPAQPQPQPQPQPSRVRDVPSSGSRRVRGLGPGRFGFAVRVREMPSSGSGSRFSSSRCAEFGFAPSSRPGRFGFAVRVREMPSSGSVRVRDMPNSGLRKFGFAPRRVRVEFAVRGDPVRVTVRPT